MSLRAPPNKKGLGAAFNGTQASSRRDVTSRIAPHPDVGNTQPQDSPTWPKDGHPFARELRLDCNYVWDRMMASVDRPGALIGEVALLRAEVAQLRRALKGGHS